ncbi:tRNA pseudouridine synthase A-like isoform X2 [Xenia sp. Carnegie-2017]|uniref:tRNA pseudouridine synthase A-like isoform X2 n=1 Tax=Xenia sp. Carnegie-2017 TaxID=2897299 RepID=UPI001F043530|nr:tRNA pseudouridine synthase A-like isoform X2 [Xenia sp. Carnegie-2017]
MAFENKKRSVDNLEDDDDESERKKIKSDSSLNETKILISTCGPESLTLDSSTKEVKRNINYNKKKKCVLLLSYCGNGYNGMQRNPGVRTIEEDLTNALFKAKAISEDASRNYGKMAFQRCARTDKGVSAARQVVSLKMVPYKELLHDINENLDPQIRVFALKQVTRGFDCKSRCTSRTYQYLLPTFAFAPTFAHTTKNFRITDEIEQKLNDVLKNYEGTKNFHNFTSGKDFKDESSKRYIIRFEVAGEAFVARKMEFIELQVQGQSFMQHQIRKMIGIMNAYIMIFLIFNVELHVYTLYLGLVIAIMKGYTGVDAISRAFEPAKMDIPRAPGLGLILEEVHFKSYNDKFGKDGFHEPLEWSECEDQIKNFKTEFIHSGIIETEATTNSMMRWLSVLGSHSYSNEGMVESKKLKDTKNMEEDANKVVTDKENTNEITRNCDNGKPNKIEMNEDCSSGQIVQLQKNSIVFSAPNDSNTNSLSEKHVPSI